MAVISDNATRKGIGNLGIAAFMRFAIASDFHAVAVLIAVSLIALLPGFSQIPPVDRDEARFAQATKQMIETGDYVDIRFQDEARYKKPVGIYWLQAAAVEIAEAAGVPRARLRIAIYRIPSLIGAVGAVLLTYWTALAFVSRRAAFLAGIMTACSILLGVEARLAKTDAMLLLAALAQAWPRSLPAARRVLPSIARASVGAESLVRSQKMSHPTATPYEPYSGTP